MEFSIYFERSIEIKEGSFSNAYMSGVICLGKFRGKFASSLNYWTREDYENQWREGIEKIVFGNSDTSALVVDIMSPDKKGSTLTWWLMYLDEKLVFFQEQFLLLSKLPKDFQLEDLYSYIPNRYNTKSDYSDELTPSEWKIKKRELEEWIAKTR